MKKNKILVLIILSLLISGCDVKYNINIRGKKISEEIILPNTDNYTVDNLTNDFYYDIENKKKYNLEIKEDKIILSNKDTKLSTLSNNNLYDYCFSKIDSFEEDGYYHFRTSSDFNCMVYEYIPIDKITIVLNTFNKVKEHNADEVKFGKYIWYIDKDNSSTKQIYFTVKKNEYLWYYRLRGLIIGLGSIVIVLLIGYFIVKIFKKKSDKENKI